LLYRVTDAHASKKYIFQTKDDVIYATTRPVTGTSSFYSFDNTETFAAAGGTTGLGIVTGRPLVSKGAMWFPQGPAVKIRDWDGTTTWDDDNDNYATFLGISQDAIDGPQVIKALNPADKTTAKTVTRANPVAAGDNHSFGDSVECGDSHHAITNLLFHSGKLYVFKEDGIGTISADKYGIYESNFSNTPSARNGAAACSWNGLMYFSWLNTVMESYGGTANDIGQAWRGLGPTGNRHGYISAILGINAWRFLALDAGSAGYSSVHIYNGMTHHEIYRAPYGHRIRDLWWQHVDGGHSRLFIDIDYDVVFLEFPNDVAKPTNDPTHEYAHSFYLTSTSFDDGAARLPKYIKSLTASVTNAGQVQDTSVWFEIDYQTDNDVGEDGAEHWYRLGKIFTSPEGMLRINDGNKRVMKVRVRGYTDTSIVPPQLDALTIDGFTRTPARTIWTMRLKTGERGIYKRKASDLLKFLQEASTSAGDILIRSPIPELNGRHVICTRPKVGRELLNLVSGAWSGTVIISFLDMSE
jgi:hypothetical protein